MKKAWVEFGFLAVVAVLGLAGCSGHKSEAVVLRFAAWGAVEETKILQASADEFKKDHPGVDVQLLRIPYGEYITKLLTQFSAGDAPDVMLVAANGQLPSFASKGVFVDLKPYVDKDPSIKLSDFYPELVDRYTVNGALVAIPRNVFPIAVVYYNKKKFDEAGLPYPKNDWGLDEFLKTAQKLTKKDAKGKIVQYGYTDDWPMWDAWTHNFGGSLVDNVKNPTRCTLDSPEAIAGVQFRVDLIYKYGTTPSPASMTAMGGMGSSDLFMNGTVAMFHSGLWVTPTFRQIKDFDWDVVELPKGPKGTRGFVMDGHGYGIVKSCKHPELAYELVKYLAGEKGQQYIAASGLAQPALQKVAQSKFFLDDQKPHSKGFLLEAVKDGRFYPFDPNAAEWTTIVGSALDRVWTGDETAEKALKKATGEVNAKFFSKPQ